MVDLPLSALTVRLLESLRQFRHLPLVGGNIGGIGLEMLPGGKGRGLLRLLFRDMLGRSLGRTFESGPGRLAIHLHFVCRGSMSYFWQRSVHVRIDSARSWRRSAFSVQGVEPLPHARRP